MIILRSQTLSKVILQFRMFRWVSITAVLTTIVISPWFTYDPINLPKVVVVTTGGFLFLGVLLSNTKEITQILGIPLFLFLVFFFIALVINLLFAPSPFTQKLWGVFGRDNGALSYLALALVLAASASIMNVNHYKKIFFLLPLTAIPISSYSLFQLAGLDPVDWSYKAAFATLGNVNFLSAFLGMACVAFLSTYFVRDIKRKIRILALLMIPIMLFIIYSTDSIQGFAVFLSGAVVIGFLEVRKRSRYFLYLFSLTTVLSFVLSVMALLNIGPLAKLIYQPSITFRFDYMHAALKTFVNNPIVGVGLDGFGDWYRNYRGIISAFRTGTSRTTNSAHNIFLDVASGGGILLLIPTLAIFIYAALVSIKALRKVENQDPVFVGLIAVWVGYLVQSLISINQIGVGIWGWIFTGVISGYARCLGVAERPGLNSSFKVNNFKNSGKREFAKLDAKSSISVFILGTLGFTLSFLPFKADMDIRAAYNRGDLRSMIEALDSPGVTSFHLSQVTFQAGQSGFPDQGDEVSKKLVLRFPRDFGGWITRYSRSGNDLSSSLIAKQKVESLDPYFYCLQEGWLEKMRRDLIALPDHDQREISGFWNLLPGGAQGNSVTFKSIPKDLFEAKLASNCQ